MRKQAFLPVMLMFLAFLAGFAEHASAQATAQTFAKPELVRPFRVEIEQKRIDAILERVRTAKLPQQMPATSAEKAAWETGADMSNTSPRAVMKARRSRCSLRTTTRAV